MPNFDVLSGTWYHITAPDLDTAKEVYEAYWEDKALPDGCDIKQGEVDSHWIPIDLDGPELTFEEFKDRIPNETTLAAMREAME